MPYALSPTILLPESSTLDNISISCVESWSLPGESKNSTGLPNPSTIAWIFVVSPPRERPVDFTSSPFYRR